MKLNIDYNVNFIDTSTPYMLRNDGALLKCGEVHPYIKEYFNDTFEQTLNYLNEHKENLKWFYNNTLNDEVKDLIPNYSKSEEILNKLYYLTNQEFCRVRTSNYKYKYGGDNGEIYFRISSTDENWFDLIYDVCAKFSNQIKYITIIKDYQTFGKQFDYIKIKGTPINKMPLDDFLSTEGNPIIESVVIKEPEFKNYSRVWATNSASEMKSAILNSSVPLRILYDTKHRFYVYSGVDSYIHRDLLEIALEYGLYPEYESRYAITGGYFEDHTYQLIYAPINKVNAVWGINIQEDGYTERIVYDFGVITGRNDRENVFLNKIPVIKQLKSREKEHTYFAGWDNDDKPIIKELIESLKDEVSENTLKKRRKYYLTHGLKNVFPSGLGESLDMNSIISLLSNTFGTTDEPQPTAMYILPNGEFLFTTPLEPSDDCDYEIDEHRNIDDFLYHKNIIKDDRYSEDDGSLFAENVLNCIRFNITDEYYGNYSYIQLNKNQPTPQQYDSLLKIFDYVINAGYKYISIIFDTQYGKQVKLELNNYTADELLKKIKRFYVSGILTETIDEDIEKHDTLNPLLFDENGELKPDIKEAIEKIVSQFVEDLKADGVKIKVKDIVLVGSNVSYNYTKDSDLDVHIIVDKDSLDCDPEIYTLLYSAHRSLFNKNYDIKIKKIPIEIYVQLV